MRITLHTFICLMFILLSTGYAAEKPSSASTSFPGLLVVSLIVKDKEKFDIYAQKVKPIFEAYKASLYFRGVNPQFLFGSHKNHMLIGFKFSSKAAIKNFYDSKDYQSLIALRTESADVVFTAYDIVQEEEQIDIRSILAVNVLIKDETKFRSYGKAAGSIVKANDGQLQLRANNPEVLFGENPYKILVLFKFPSKEAIQTFYNSEEYQKIIPLRTEGADVVFTSYDL